MDEYFISLNEQMIKILANDEDLANEFFKNSR